MPKRTSKKGLGKKAKVSARARSGVARLGPLAKFARDLADRMRGTVAERFTRVAPSRGSPGRRLTRGASGGGPLAGIADRVLRLRLPNTVEAVEVALLTRAMENAGGNITAAGRLLGIHRKAVERGLTKHKLGSSNRRRRRGRPRTAR